MATQSIGVRKAAVSIGATADTVSLKTPCKQVKLRNTHATQTLACIPWGGDTEAAALAAAVAANTAAAITATTDNAYTIAAGDEEVVWKSKRGQYVAFQVIASGAATLVNFIGTDWLEGQ